MYKHPVGAHTLYNIIIQKYIHKVTNADEQKDVIVYMKRKKVIRHVNLSFQPFCIGGIQQLLLVPCKSTTNIWLG